MDFADRHALVGQVQHLVVHVGIQVTLGAQHFLDAGVAPARPAVRRKHHLHVREAVERGVDVLGPVERVSHRRTAQGVDVVDGAGDVLGTPEGLPLGEPGVHLGGRLGVGRVLEDHLDAVDGEVLEVLADQHVGRDQAGIAMGHVLADRLVHMAEGAARQQGAVLDAAAPAHGITREDVFGNGFVQEAFRRDDLHLAGVHVGLVHHTPHTAEVVHVGMGIHHCHHGAGAEFVVDELQGGAGRFGGGCGVENDPAGVALDEGDVGQVEAAHLVDLAGQHFIQAVGHVEDGLALQRGVDAVEILALQQEAVAFHVPGHVAGIGHDLLERRHGDQAALGFLEIALVLEGQGLLHPVAQLHGETGCRLAFRVEMRVLRGSRAGGGQESKAAGQRDGCGNNG